MARYAFAIFLGAFLLFQVQPVIGKYILPWFGGTSSVWTTCLLFFQVMLLVGYAYAHLVSTFFKSTRGWVHLVLLVLSLLALPIMPDADTWRPDPDTAPTVQILSLLFISIGFPYLLLSSTGPLLQRWFSLSHAGRSPYRLYALSNLGSLLALLTYPFLVEPLIARKLQVIGWSWSYVAFVGASAICAWKISTLKIEPDADRVSAPSPQTRIPLTRLLFWLALTASASAMLLATTNQLTVDIAAVPFLWVLPLSIYLLSFILCFDSDRWYNRVVFGALLIITVPLACLALEQEAGMDLVPQILIYSATLFVCAMACHGELVRDKPGPEHLTLFYLVVAAGGALGGVFVAIVAPLIFSGFWEFHVALASSVALTVVGWWRAFRRHTNASRLRRQRSRWTMVAATLGLFGLVYYLNGHARAYHSGVIEQSRNFYGVLRVIENRPHRATWHRILMHGNIRHGTQYMAEDKRALPVDYFGVDSGVGLALRHHPKRKERSLKVAVLGLGTGTLATFGKPDDEFRFFEINPEVHRLAREYFSYLDDTPAQVTVTLGDGRIELENALSAGEAGTYDVIVLDAFSGDSVPIHLLTVEAARLYWKLLSPDGLLLFHITNRFVNLRPLMVGLARETDTEMAIVVNRFAKYVTATHWAILGRHDNPFFDDPAVENELWHWSGAKDGGIVWTDDYASLLRVLK